MRPGDLMAAGCVALAAAADGGLTLLIVSAGTAAVCRYRFRQRMRCLDSEVRESQRSDILSRMRGHKPGSDDYVRCERELDAVAQGVTTPGAVQAQDIAGFLAGAAGFINPVVGVTALGATALASARGKARRRKLQELERALSK